MNLITDMDNPDVCAIIKLLKRHPCLHNPNSVYYISTAKKLVSYKQIAVALNRNSSTIYSAEDIKENIKNIKKEYRKYRNNYMKEYSRNKRLPEAAQWWKILYSFIKDQNQLNDKSKNPNTKRTMQNKIKRYLRAEKQYKEDLLSDNSSGDDSDEDDSDEEGNDSSQSSVAGTKGAGVKSADSNNVDDSKTIDNATETSANKTAGESRPRPTNESDSDSGPHAKKPRASPPRTNIIDTPSDFEADIIIRELRNEPCLCDPKHRHYKNVREKEAAYQRIADAVNNFDDLGFTAEHVKINLQILRKAFRNRRNIRLREFGLKKKLLEPDDWWRNLYDVLLDENKHGESLCIHKPLTKAEVNRRFGKLIDQYHKYEEARLSTHRGEYCDNEEYESDNDILEKTSCSIRCKLICMKRLTKWK